MTCPPANASNRPRIIAGTLVGTAAKSFRKKSSIVGWLADPVAGKAARRRLELRGGQFRVFQNERPVEAVLADYRYAVHVFGGAALHQAEDLHQLLEPIGKLIGKLQLQNHLFPEHEQRVVHP